MPLVQEDLSILENILSKYLESAIPLIPETTSHLISAGGKRLRPILLFLAYKACQLDKKQAQVDTLLKLGAVLEYIHAASLLHDDVIDEATERRGQTSVNAMWGNKTAILMGDFLYSKAFEIIVDIKQNDVLSLLAHAVNQVAQGEIQQLVNQGNARLQESTYFEIIENKTAKLFEIAGTLAAVINQAQPRIQQALSLYGKHVGLAFQLMDDLLDYQSSLKKLGKPTGQDLQEGKPTLPFIRLMELASPIEQNIAADALKQKKVEMLPTLHTLMHQHKVFEYTLKVAIGHAEKAIDAIQPLKDSSYKDGLIELACFAVERDH